MEIGAVIPHSEIGTDSDAIRAYAQGVEEIGMTHLLIYDHVVGVGHLARSVEYRAAVADIV